MSILPPTISRRTNASDILVRSCTSGPRTTRSFQLSSDLNLVQTRRLLPARELLMPPRHIVVTTVSSI